MQGPLYMDLSPEMSTHSWNGNNFIQPWYNGVVIKRSTRSYLSLDCQNLTTHLAGCTATNCPGHQAPPPSNFTHTTISTVQESEKILSVNLRKHMHVLPICATMYFSAHFRTIFYQNFTEGLPLIMSSVCCRLNNLVLGIHIIKSFTRKKFVCWLKFSK